MRRPTLPPLPSLLAALAFLAAGAAAAVAARSLVAAVEDRSVAAVGIALRDGGHGWATVLGDGLQVVLEGEAPSEAMRFRAISAAGTAVDASRVIDNLRVAAAEALAPPAFAMEILRNGDAVSAIGLIPAATDRLGLADALEGAVGGGEVADLLQVADHPVPEGWEAALAYALTALADLPQAKVSVGPGQVAVEALADGEPARAEVERRLRAAVPEGVELTLRVSAPRPVIAPFALRATLADGRLRLDACSAETAAQRGEIAAAARAAGAEGAVECRLGLGSPSPGWAEAAALGLAALDGLGGGILAMTDADMALVAPPGTDRRLFDRVAAELDGALPAVFALTAERPEPAPRAAGGAAPPEFVATLSAEGAVRLGGPVPDARMSEATASFARARFGTEAVTLATRVAPAALPEGWSMRVLAGLDALSRLAVGRVTVTPDRIAVHGRSGDRAAGDAIAAGVVAALGAEADLELAVAYDATLDPLTGLPTPEECLARIAALTADAKITFDPGSATIAGDAEPVVEAIADVLRACADLRLRIGGYTDSQGREESNLALSQARAEAVLAALRAERVPVGGFEARGFGEADPLASNDSEAGREANRRIEFALIGAPAAPPPGAAAPGPAVGPGAPAAPSALAAPPAALSTGEPPARPAARPAAAAGGEASAEEAEP